MTNATQVKQRIHGFLRNSMSMEWNYIWWLGENAFDVERQVLRTGHGLHGPRVLFYEKRLLYSRENKTFTA